MSATDDIFQALFELNGKIGIMNTEIGRIKNDVDWIKGSVADINSRQKACSACINSNYLTEQADTNRADIKCLQEDRNKMYGLIIAVPILITILLTFVK